jgi:2-dehydro-3-deoxyphosphogluconate aldolase/(4S)-4-hydroxy-2-oxoglutarate aldolase
MMKTLIALEAVGGAEWLDQQVACSPIIPVISIQRLEDAVPMAQALVRGGLRMLEVTLRTPCALAAIRAIKQAIPEAIVGAGTVLHTTQVEEVRSAGAEFIVTPGSTGKLLEALIDSGIPFLPGVSTLSEILMGYELGLRRFKFFPAEVAGGVNALRSFAGPLPDIRFCPTGGIRPDNLLSYLNTENVMAVGGTWLTSDALVKARNWAAIEMLAWQAVALAAGKVVL